ncbi:MAG: nitrogen regulation protein NR(II) [Parashewanella sp.]
MEAHQVLEHLATAVITVDPKLTIHYVNASACQLLSSSHTKLLNKPLMEQVNLLGVEPSKLTDSIAQGQSLSVNQTQLINNDGQRFYVDLTLLPLATNQGFSVIELRQVDQQQRIYQQLNQDAQQQAAQFLVRNLAHEIKNPLGGLRGAAQLLARELTDNTQQEFTTMIIEQADRMRSLVDRLLGPQVPSPHKQENIHRVIEKVLRLIQVGLPQEIKLVRDYDPSLPNLKIDPELLQQALLNLLQNAQQAIEPKSGVITVRTRMKHQMTIADVRYKSVIEVAIMDTGIGVPDALKDTLFYPMVTGRSEGTGLGLSIAHNIVRQHLGRIECESQQGKTEFRLLLPMREEA